MIDCQESVRRMWAYLDDVLEPGPTRELDEHLDACRRCCGELEFSRHLRSMVAEKESAVAVSPELCSRIESLLVGGPAEPPGDEP